MLSLLDQEKMLNLTLRFLFFIADNASAKIRRDPIAIGFKVRFLSNRENLAKTNTAMVNTSPRFILAIVVACIFYFREFL